MENATSLLEAIAHLTGENLTLLEKNRSQPIKNPEVRKHLQSKNILASGISILVEVDYTSLSGKSQLRDIIIRRVIKSGKDFFIDAFCLAIQAPRLIKIDSIKRIKNKKTNQEYMSPKAFFEEVLGIEFNKDQTLNNIHSSLQTAPQGELKTAINRSRSEITALMFISGIDGSREHAEFEQIAQYVHRRCPDLVFKDEDLYRYLNILYPDRESFYQSMESILRKDAWIIKLFLEHMIHLITSDGKIDTKERVFLAEIITILKNEGFIINF